MFPLYANSIALPVFFFSSSLLHTTAVGDANTGAGTHGLSSYSILVTYRPGTTTSPT